MLHVAFVRSDHAHGRLLKVDVSAARARSGVAAVYTFDDLGEYGRPAPLLVPPPPIAGLVFHPRMHCPLAGGKVRYVGEPIAMIVAESRYLAEDAVRDVIVEVDPLDAVVDLEAALAPGAARVHDDLDSNAAAHVVQRKGDYAAARARADAVVARRFTYDRGAAAALENRCVVATWDRQAEELTIWDTTQAPIPIRNGLAARLGLLESQVRVVAPFVGGGFGPKIMMFYPEELLVPWASMRLARPIKWTEDRQENFYATTQERGQIHDAEMALTRDGRILGVRDTFLFDTGAYDPYGLTIPINTQCTLLGPYDIPSYDSEFTAVFTNKTIVTPVRGAGRQHGVFVSERLLDLAARELGIDRLEIRKRNLLGPDRFPHNHEIMFQDSAPLVYDSGDYLPALEQAAATIGYEDLIRQQARRRSGNRRVGVGIACYVEGTGIGPYEGARVTVEPSGKVRVATGVGTQGQGHYTVFAQVVADVLGVSVEDVQVVTGDTREFQWGTGTFASRGAVVAGSACHAAAISVREKIVALAASVLAAEPSELEVTNGRVSVRGAADRTISLAQLAARANPLRGAVRPGTEPGLESTAYFGPDRGSTASGVHAMIVEVDVETAMVEVKRYLVVHDCGRIINPLLVEGQIHGGVAQGLGNAFYEQLVYDEQGQLLNASFMDYLLPTATDVPTIETAHRETPSPFNPVGLKGVGEAGCIPTGAAFAQAVEDALNIEILDIPLSPNRLFTLIQQAAHR
jgi:carbon-monoxide dehydrogenase large subunit